MYYHFAIILLFRPFLNLQFIGSSVSPREICTQAAESLTSLIQTYRQLYSLRRTPSFIPYMVLASNLALLIDQRLHNTITGTKAVAFKLNALQDLVELSVSHAAARKFIYILRYFGRAWDIPIIDTSDPTQAHMEDRTGSPLPGSLGTFFDPESGTALATGTERAEDGKLPTTFLRNILFRLFPNQGLPSVHAASLWEEDDQSPGEQADQIRRIAEELRIDGFYGVGTSMG